MICPSLVYTARCMLTQVDPLEHVQLCCKFLILKLTCLSLMGFTLPLPSGFEFQGAVVESCRLKLEHPVPSLMLYSHGQTHSFTVVSLHHLSFASLAHTFTTIHTLQYVMRDHDNINN